MSILTTWVARKSDEEVLTAITRMDAIHAMNDHPVPANRPIYDALREEAVARGLFCSNCGEKPVTTLASDGEWSGCYDCATAPTHP